MSNKCNRATACGNDRHVVLFGKVGSGKTSIFNQLVDHAEKSPESECDPIVGVCRLGQVGSIVLIDTGRFNGAAELKDEAEHMRRTYNIVRRADIAIYVTDLQEFDREAYKRDREWINRNMVPFLLVFNRCDEAYAGDIARYKTEFPEAIFISANTPGSISLLRARLSQMLRELNEREAPLIPKDLVKPGDYVLLLVTRGGDSPIRSEQSMITQLIAHGAHCVVADETSVKQVLAELPRVNLVIAYARSFAYMRDAIPEDIPLTSYSLLYGMQSGSLGAFIQGAHTVNTLTESSRVLITEGCMHGSNHRDIGRVKIPRALRRLAGEGLRIDYTFGPDLPEDIEKYDLVIHCSGCSMTLRAVQARVAYCQEAGVPIANYGTVLAELAGILPRCTKVLLPDEDR